MTGWEQHRLELLRAFKIGERDLQANRDGRLGPAQARRMRRGIGLNLLGSAALVAGFVVTLYFAAAHPFQPVQWVLSVTVAMAGLAVGAVAARNLVRALRSGVVECLEGPVSVGMRGRSGWWLTVRDRSFHVPVHFWHVGRGARYRVYVAPAAKLIVAMEPAGEDATA
jgi:hypothetical protein